MARLFSKAVNCTNRAPDSAEPCNTCPSCENVNKNRAIDIIEIDAASQTGVDNVRENIIENSELQPTSARYKIFIIDEVHMLSTSAFNALLKTLEEPPAHTIFILATTELQKLPATVVSRCQRFHFQKIPTALMLEKLNKIVTEEQVAVEPAVLNRVIRQSEGCMRDAESLLGQILSLNKKTITSSDVSALLPTTDATQLIDYMQCLLKNETENALTIVTHIVAEGGNLDRFFVDLIELLRLLLWLQVAPQKIDSTMSDYTAEDTATLKKLSGLANENELIQLIELALKRRLETKTAPLPQLPLELLTIEWCCRQEPEAPTPSPAVVPQSQPRKTTPISVTPKPAAVSPVAPPAPLPSEEATPAATIAGSIKSALTSITAHRCQTTLADITAHWNEVIAQLASSNPSLTFILKMCTIQSADENGVTVTVPFAIHKEKLQEAKNRKLIEHAFVAIFKEKIPLYCSVAATTETTSPPAPTDTAMLTNLAAEFGGEIVS